VRYCAEQFANDDSMSSTMMKALKRTMAAEFSRELAVKVHAGMKRLVLLGYRMSEAPLGLRRMMICTNGRKQILRSGEQKFIKSAHSVLVPGPKREVKAVKTIFALAESGKTVPEIAAELNKLKIKDSRGRRLECRQLYKILHNEVYTGCSIWGKTSQKSSGRPIRVRPESWIRVPGVFPCMIDPRVFERVQKRFARRTKSDDTLLRRMKRVLAKRGKLTQRLLKREVSFDYRTYRRRFGSIFRAYELIGYKPSLCAVRNGRSQRKIWDLRFGLFLQLKQLFPGRVQVIQEPLHNQRKLIVVDGRIRVAVQVGCPHRTLVGGQTRWLLKVHPLERGLTTLICTTSRELDKMLDFYVVPQFGKGMRRFRVFGHDSHWLRFSRKLHDLSEFCDAVHEVAGAASQESIAMHRVGDTVLFEHTRTVTIAGKEIYLAPMEHAMFRLLVLNNGSVVSRQQLCRATQKKEIQHLNAKMSELRGKLGIFADRITRVPKIGYFYNTNSCPLAVRSDQSHQA
jgi:DNA-binding winged helix-turn-helix (wHTH) protein